MKSPDAGRPRAASMPICSVELSRSAFTLPVATAASATTRWRRLCLLQIAAEQRPHPPEQRSVPAEKGLAQLSGETLEGDDLPVKIGEPAEFEKGDDQEPVAEQFHHAVASHGPVPHDRSGVENANFAVLGGT